MSVKGSLYPVHSSRNQEIGPGEKDERGGTGEEWGDKATRHYITLVGKITCIQ